MFQKEVTAVVFAECSRKGRTNIKEEKKEKTEKKEMEVGGREGETA